MCKSVCLSTHMSVTCILQSVSACHPLGYCQPGWWACECLPVYTSVICSTGSALYLLEYEYLSARMRMWSLSTRLPVFYSAYQQWEHVSQNEPLNACLSVNMFFTRVFCLVWLSYVSASVSLNNSCECLSASLHMSTVFCSLVCLSSVLHVIQDEHVNDLSVCLSIRLPVFHSACLSTMSASVSLDEHLNACLSVNMFVNVFYLCFLCFWFC